MPKKIKKNKPHTRPNRLPSLPGGGKRHNIYLDETTIYNAKIIGDGNLSAGIRIAIEKYSRDFINIKLLNTN